jgi:phage tail-like protein
MPIQRDRPYGNYNFLVTFDSAAEADGGFAEVVLPEVSIDVIEYRTGGDKESGVRKIPGRAHYSNVVLTRGVIGSLTLYQWLNDVRNGNVRAFRTVLVQLQNEDRTEIVWTWRFLRAWPARYRFSPLEAKGKDALLEHVELAFERMEVE